MGLWAFHTFVHETDVAALERAVQQVLALDQYEPIVKPTPEESLEHRTSRYGEQTSLREGFCGVLLISGTSDDQQWSYIQCAPDSLFCERARGTEHPRLAELAKILQVDAFRLEVEDGDSAVLLECRGNGEFCVSGALTSMLEEAYGDYTGETDEETEAPTLKYFEEEVQGDEPTFELLSEFKAFSPANFGYPEPAVYEIEAKFLGSLDGDLAWIHHENRLFNAEPINTTENSTVRALYFRRRG
jgi:hypothetical protein